MIETLTAESFRPLVGRAGELEVLRDPVVRPGPPVPEAVPTGSRLPVTLTGVRTTGAEAFRSGHAPPRLPFSVILQGPAQPVLAQRIYRLHLPELGALDLFLVPVGLDPGGVLYEVCFT
jgi:hypothetical protein